MSRINSLDICIDDVDNLRAFQIRDGDGCSVCYFVTKDTPNDEIFDCACDVITTAKHNCSAKQYWYSNVKVVEIPVRVVKINKPNSRGRLFRLNTSLSALRNGLKFIIEHDFLQVKFADGSVRRSDGYSFGKVL